MVVSSVIGVRLTGVASCVRRVRLRDFPCYED